MKTIENQGFLTSQHAMGRSERAKPPVVSPIANNIRGFRAVARRGGIHHHAAHTTTKTTTEMNRMKGKMRHVFIALAVRRD
jgi:hypothetical protein